jgi:hypothetical protein
MTQAQYQWLQDNGYDPTVYDVDPRGRVVKSPVAPEPVQQKMSPLRAAGTSFLGNLLPSAAGLGGAKLGMMAGAPFGPIGVGIGAIGGGLGAGYLAGRGQEAALEQIAPSALEEMRRAEQDQPIYSYLGGFAPNALAFRPSVQGMKGLLRPTVRGTETLTEALAKPEFIAPAANIAANVAGSTAGQLVNMSQGGEFSGPRFAADVTLGTLFNRPTALGRRMGFQDIPEPRREAPGDLAAAREQAAFMEYPPQDFITPREERGAQDIKTPGVNITPEGPEQFFTAEGKRMTEKAMAKDYTNWWKSETEPTTDLIKGAAEEIKMKVPKERLAELAQDPEVGAALRDPSRMPAFIAKQAEQSLEDVYQMMARREVEQRFASPEEAANQRALQELRAERGLPSETALSDVEEAYAARQRTPTKQAQELYGTELAGGSGRPPSLSQVAGADKSAYEAYSGGAPKQRVSTGARFLTAADAENQRALQKLRAERGLPNESPLSDINAAYEAAARSKAASQRTADVRARELYSPELTGISGRPPSVSKASEGYQLIPPTESPRSAIEAGREVYSQELEGPSGRPPSVGQVAKADKTAYEAYSGVRPAPEVKNATEAAREIYTRLQRPAEEYTGKITQEDINLATEIANRRGLKIELDRAYAGDQQVRGLYMVDADGNRIIRVNPLMATADTAIHEIGHDIFKGVTNKGMRRSLMDTAMDSPAYKAELAARAEEVKQGKITQEQANDIALEEGLIQAFGEQMPQVKRGELRAWYQAFKASMKQLVTGKMSPEDALAWMHYATTEAVPWKGVAVAKVDVGGERMQRGSELFSLTNEDFAPSSDPKFLHATHLEQNNPTGLRVAAREPSGKVTIGKLGDLHMDLPAVAENSEFGFVDKTGNFLTREQASAQRANPDIRYQRSILSEAKTPAELDYLASKGGPFADVATNVKAAYNTRDFKQGQWSSKFSLTSALPEEARVRLFNHLAGEFDSGVRSTPASDIRAAYDQLRNEYLPAIVNDYNAQGFTVRDTAGQRARGSNPTYFPLHSVADDVERILTTMQGSPEWDKLKADFINWNTQLRQADGASLQEAQRYADEKFQERVGITSKPPGIESGIPFSGARKPEGYPLPPSWRSNDIIDILNNYTRRSATDFAYQQHVESSPVAMAALGAKTMLNNQPIPANVLQSTPLIINEPSVQSVLREYRGTPAQRTDGALQSFGRFVSASTIGPVSKVGDIGTSMFKGLAYLQGSEYASGLADFTKRIGDWAALKERSYASGLNKRDAAENMRQVLGIAEDSTAFMDKAARVLSKATFVNDLESAARVIAQGWGETIVGINKKLALSGDKNATQMLDTLTKDWRTRSDADLAAQVGRLLQGSYDMRQLPASVLEGAAAPYLTWSKWSIGQYDSFVKYALQPAMQGNMKPLIGQMLIGVLGGGSIAAVQEWLNNREGKDISWKELESWMQQNQGELGADGGQLLGQKLLSMAQKMGTFGFAGDLVKMTLDAYAGGASQGIATMPAIDAIYDVSKRAAAAGKALDDGEDFGLVLKALLQDSLTGHVQALRVARNWLDEDENLRYDDRRKRRLFDELSGLPNKGGTFAVNYSNLSEREFERGEITPQTGEEAFSLVSRAREEATTPEDYASRIRKYKTSQNQIMPSLERQPMKAARYLSFVEGAEEGAGAETLKRYLTREQENKYRKSLIEGMSGLR